MTVPVTHKGEETFVSQSELDAHLRTLETEMREAAANLEFERAAALRDKIRAFRSPGYSFS